ncbi:MAG: inorganic diphosphatase [Planctomycetota bacterium]|jgi:inorganic pyrophosphatase
MNPWHDVALGKDPGRLFMAVIEIPRGSKNKYELDKRTGLLRLDRVLYSSVHYPANYGFLPRTYCDDGDPLDVLVLCQEPLVPLCLVQSRPIGLISMQDDKGVDDKIIAVPDDDPEYAHYTDVSQLPPHRMEELKQFLRDYKTLERKRVDVDEMRGREEAVKVINQAVQLYVKEILPTLGS